MGVGKKNIPMGYPGHTLVAGNGEDNDNSGESFFEGFFNDTESYDDASSIISAASHGQLTVVAM